MILTKLQQLFAYIVLYQLLNNIRIYIIEYAPDNLDSNNMQVRNIAQIIWRLLSHQLNRITYKQNGPPNSLQIKTTC